MRELLIRHFLWRFLEHDLVSPNTDRRGVLSAAAGLVLGGSLFVAILVAWPYQLFPAMAAGSASLRSLDDRYLFVSVSMLAMALAAIAQWDALMLDHRDAAVLGALPIPHRVLVSAKLTATGIFALGTLTACNAIPTLLRGAAVPAGLGVGWVATLHLTVAHGVATSAAGAFGFLIVLGAREIACAALGETFFHRISTALQAAFLVLTVVAILALFSPGASSRIGERWLARNAAAAMATPPLWFVGLHETLAGSVIDGVPRSRIRGYLRREDDAATATYRRLSPRFSVFGRIAVTALMTLALVTVGACLWNSRRVPTVSRRRRLTGGAGGHAWNGLATRVLTRNPVQQAGFVFAAHSLWRGQAQRLTLSVAFAVALSVLLAANVGDSPRLGGSVPATTGFLAGQYLALAAVVAGFRQATRLPADLRAALTCELAWPGQSTNFVTGVKHAGWFTVLLPALAVLWVWHIGPLGLRSASWHTALGAAVASLMMEVAFFHSRRVPLLSAYVPRSDGTPSSVLLGVSTLIASLALAAAERASVVHHWLYIGLLVGALGAAQCLRRLDRVSGTAVIERDVDEQASLPTQRLGLSG